MSAKRPRRDADDVDGDYPYRRRHTPQTRAIDALYHAIVREQNLRDKASCVGIHPAARQDVLAACRAVLATELTP